MIENKNTVLYTVQYIIVWRQNIMLPIYQVGVETETNKYHKYKYYHLFLIFF